MPYFGNNPSPLLLNTVAQNGKEMTLDADADTSITADTDDQIDIKIGGSDIFQLTASKLDINGKELVLDADADTSITADTDDQIDIRIGGADDFQFTANTFTAQSGSTIAAQALTATTITASGILKTDDTTDATSTTDGSLQTDGGLSVAKDAVIGDDILLKSDSAAIQFGADSEITLTHSHDAGLSLRNSSSTGPVLNIGTTSTSVSDGGFIGGIMFDAGSSNSATARIQALASGTSEDGADISFECRDSGASFTEKFRIDGDGNVKVNEGNLIIGTSGKGIDFSANTESSVSGVSNQSELFDYYEEGTWTPVPYGTTTAGSVTSGTTVGRYTRVGNIVYAEYRLSAIVLSSAAGSYYIAGLPYTVGGTAYNGGSAAYHSLTFYGDQIVDLNAAGTSLYFIVSRSGTSWTSLDQSAFGSQHYSHGTITYTV